MVACQDDKECTTLRYHDKDKGIGFWDAYKSTLIAPAVFFSIDLDELLCHNVVIRCFGYPSKLSTNPPQTLILRR